MPIPAITELKEPCPILRVETIAEFLDVVPGKIRTALFNIQDGGYCIEIRSGQWIRIISVPVERAGGMAWTPAIPAPVEPTLELPAAVEEVAVVDPDACQPQPNARNPYTFDDDDPFDIPKPATAAAEEPVDDRPFPLVFPADRFKFKPTKQEGK